MGDSSAASYIHLVHHLIEECIIFNMSREECMEALSKHANIQPLITSTGRSQLTPTEVWNELVKTNKEFFEKYLSNRPKRASDMKASRRINEILASSSSCSSSSPSTSDGSDS